VPRHILVNASNMSYGLDVDKGWSICIPSEWKKTWVNLRRELI
jgi:hypothetical protein